ncbi:hypothetical protein FJ251_06065 [bacterium]|nr:hypothetical protein [bacterium]
MRTLLAVLMLLVPALAGAAAVEIPVSTQSIGVLGYGAGTLETFTLDLGDLAAEDLLEASLELLIQPDAPEGARFVEVQVAAWVNGAPQIPAGRSGYMAEIAADRGEDATVYLDITPILADALAAEESEPTLVVGAIAEDTLPGATVLPWDSQQGIWGVVRILRK